MPKLSFMKWFPLDWFRDTRILSVEAKGAWIDILCYMWNAPERGRLECSKIDLARLLNMPAKRLEPIIGELAKVGTVTFRDNQVTLENRRMLKQEKNYKDHAIRQRKYIERHANDKIVTDKTLDVRRPQDVRLLKTTAGNGPPAISLAEYVNGWKRREEWERRDHAAEIAEEIKKFKLPFRTEEDIYNQIMGKGDDNGTVRGKSIDQQAAERKRALADGTIRSLVTNDDPRKILDRIRNLPKVQPET